MKLFLTIFLTTIVINTYAQEIKFVNYDGFLSIGTMENRTASITPYDIDKDGDLDILVANGRHWAEQNYIFFNNGKGSFKIAQTIGYLLNASYAIGVGDFNNDGFNDIAVVNDNSPNMIYWGEKDYRYQKMTAFGSEDTPSRNIKIVDIDQDKDLNADGLIDIVESNSGELNLFYLTKKK